MYMSQMPRHRQNSLGGVRAKCHHLPERANRKPWACLSRAGLGLPSSCLSWPVIKIPGIVPVGTLRSRMESQTLATQLAQNRICLTSRILQQSL